MRFSFWLFHFRSIYAEDLVVLDELIKENITDKEFVLRALHHFLVFPKIQTQTLSMYDDETLLRIAAKWGISHLGRSVWLVGIPNIYEFRAAMTRRVRFYQGYSAQVVPERPDPLWQRLLIILFLLITSPVILVMALWEWWNWKRNQGYCYRVKMWRRYGN